jgi:hypothetical protein
MRVISLVLGLFLLTGCGQTDPPFDTGETSSNDRIQPYVDNPRYWQYEGQPVLLLGGTKDDNLFQIPDLEEHLDLLQSVGGNYIRNTMSDRQTRGYEVYPFKKLDNGKYDLEQWNSEYWKRFERMLELTEERRIFPQIELWDQHDHNEDKWQDSPWNPDQNVNYDTSQVTLEGNGHYENVQHNSGIQHDLYMTVPELQDDQTVLAYQERFIDKVLEYTLQHDHVLYTITNELFIQHPSAWSRYWANYLRKRAREEGAEIEITEMFQINDVEHEQHRASLDHPETFDYVDISQNARRVGQEHWDKLQWVRSYISEAPRPINHVKTYGGETEWTYGPEQAIDCFWRSIIGGAASMRFHRPPAGIGLNERVQAHLKSSRMLTEAVDMFTAEADVNSRLLSSRDDDEAYLTFVPGNTYAVYFPDGGTVELDLTKTGEPYRMRWLNIEESRWQGETEVEGKQRVSLETPGSGDWVAVLETP